MKIDIVGGAPPILLEDELGYVGGSVGLQMRPTAAAPAYWGRTSAEASVDDGWEMEPGDRLGVDVRNGQSVYLFAEQDTSIIAVRL